MINALVCAAARSILPSGAVTLIQTSSRRASRTNALDLPISQESHYTFASANRIKDIILAAAGHDLRQPLQVISMAISALSRRPLTDRESKHLERADKAVDQLGARYALHGNVRHSGERLRISAQLIDTSDGAI